MRGLQSIRSGQCLREGIEAIQVIRRGDLEPDRRASPAGVKGTAPARAELVTLQRLAGALRLTA
jgi:hypothetical protein